MTGWWVLAGVLMWAALVGLIVRGFHVINQADQRRRR